MADHRLTPPPVPSRSPGRGPRRAAARLAGAVAAGAVAAGAAAALVVSPWSDEGGPGGSAPALARLADLVPAAAIPLNPGPLRPVIASPGRPGFEPPALESLEGGIRPAEPARISIPDARVDAAIEPVRATSRGIEVPGVGRAGWLDAGPRPGESGRSVVIGHLDGGTGPGIFARLPTVPPGTRIDVTDRRGDVHSYRVVGAAAVEKADFPSESVYGASENPILVLITCGGPYQEGKGYRDNVLVYARAA